MLPYSSWILQLPRERWKLYPANLAWSQTAKESFDSATRASNMLNQLLSMCLTHSLSYKRQKYCLTFPCVWKERKQHKSISSCWASESCMRVFHRCCTHLVAWHPQNIWAELSCVSGALWSTALGTNTFVSICIHSWILQVLRAKGCACHEEWLSGLKVMGTYLVFCVTALYFKR